MTGIPLLEDCNFYTQVTDSGQFIGRVREFPKLRTRPQTNALDARTDIITLTRDKIANLAQAHALALFMRKHSKDTTNEPIPPDTCL
ncbi:hypothetical protein SEA_IDENTITYCRISIS_48 [Mycobacterium phage IdentityCrisis]|uniref:Uncharacterized protein n=1 Tax=Mycobacterium phage IdentityCrisis TaxID=2599866 RepID=A0A5J6TJD0_9CAUD|nr:hypothetical protein QEH37_gp47 [Mycobacterium phage IdentityCrisis]QFG10067.1 hypothetical protein SEA_IDENTITYCRISIS_48 [Mycobacterium phage IdentityCrisis]